MLRKAVTALPEGPVAPLCRLFPGLCPVAGTILPPSWDHIPRAMRGLLVRSETSAHRGRGLFMFIVEELRFPPPSLAVCGCPTGLLQPGHTVSSVEGVGLGQGVAEALGGLGDTDISWRVSPAPSWPCDPVPPPPGAESPSAGGGSDQELRGASGSAGLSPCDSRGASRHTPAPSLTLGRAWLQGWPMRLTGPLGPCQA